MTSYYKTRLPAEKTSFYPLLGNIMNDIFESARKETTTTNVRLKTNIQEFDNRFAVAVALPGFSKDQVKIHLEDDLLTISDASVKDDTEHKFRLREFNYRGFKKSFRLPDTVDQGQINASFNAGVLVLELGKKKEAIPQPPRTIKIN